jgi:hypothetical protein
MVLLLFVLMLLGFGVLSWLCGPDSRDGRDWSNRSR